LPTGNSQEFVDLLADVSSETAGEHLVQAGFDEFSPFLRLAFCLVLRHSVLLLQTLNESVARASSIIQVIVGEFTTSASPIL